MWEFSQIWTWKACTSVASLVHWRTNFCVWTFFQIHCRLFWIINKSQQFQTNHFCDLSTLYPEMLTTVIRVKLHMSIQKCQLDSTCNSILCFTVLYSMMCQVLFFWAIMQPLGKYTFLVLVNLFWGNINIIDLMQIWRLLISINWISSTKEMNSITRKSMSKLVKFQSCRPNTRNGRHLKNSKISLSFRCLPFRMCFTYRSETWLCY